MKIIWVVDEINTTYKNVQTWMSHMLQMRRREINGIFRIFPELKTT